jgi:histone deacetylase complex regulatory component SIN3
VAQRSGPITDGRGIAHHTKQYSTAKQAVQEERPAHEAHAGQFSKMVNILETFAM